MLYGESEVTIGDDKKVLKVGAIVSYCASRTSRCNLFIDGVLIDVFSPPGKTL
jgi:hypothetical protein